MGWSVSVVAAGLSGVVAVEGAGLLVLLVVGEVARLRKALRDVSPHRHLATITRNHSRSASGTADRVVSAPGSLGCDDISLLSGVVVG